MSYGLRMKMPMMTISVMNTEIRSRAQEMTKYLFFHLAKHCTGIAEEVFITARITHILKLDSGLFNSDNIIRYKQ